MSWRIHVFGVRHLSPMGAWQLRGFLDRTRPELVLVEGLDDATSLTPDIVRKPSRPPLAILAYTDSQPVRSLVYPLASYSPEYQAILWGRAHGVAVEFFDLPSDIFLGLQDIEIERRERARQIADPAHDPEGAAGTATPASEATPNGARPPDPAATPEDSSETPESRNSLYQKIAEMAGERDYDTYWERHFEHNADGDSYRGAALELGQSLRDLEEDQPVWRAENLVREAYMRRRVEQAIAAGYSPDKIVAVVGAFHAPVLTGDFPAMTDAELASLRRRSSKLTLMPYSYFRLSSRTGYGAGNLAPAYFELLWDALNGDGVGDLSKRYLSKVARQLRESGMHRSTAEVIDATRLAETLSALMDGLAPTLADLRDSAVALLGQGELGAIKDALTWVEVGVEIGELPAGVSQTSIQADFNREIRRLRLEKYRVTQPRELDLDLRENRRAKGEEAAFLDLHRSTFLHRLRVLRVSFAKPTSRRQQDATWAEKWTLQWTPESEIELVEATLLGETIETAAAIRLSSLLEACGSLAEAARLLSDALQCDLMTSMELARKRLQELGAKSVDFIELAAAAWRLSLVIRYGEARRFDARPLVPLLEELFVGATLALRSSAICDHASVAPMAIAIDEMNRVALEFHDLVEESLWLDQLRKLADADDRNPALSGYACALLLERGLMENEALAREVSRRLSPGAPADLGAGWFEGLSRRNRYALLARQSLWEALAAYIESLDLDQFRRALVFLRRAFGPFSAREKRQIAENLGEIWGVHADVASESIERPLSEAEEKTLADLNEFDFDV